VLSGRYAQEKDELSKRKDNALQRDISSNEMRNLIGGGGGGEGGGGGFSKLQ
jgi:hypothetical protein